MCVNPKLRIVREDYPIEKWRVRNIPPVNSARNSTYSSVTAGERAQTCISNAFVQSRAEMSELGRPVVVVVEVAVGITGGKRDTDRG